MSDQIANVQQQAKKLFTKVQHYYVWNTKRVGSRNERHPIATVVIGKRKGSGRLCRGISICSLNDNFDREEGIKLATGRLIAAAVTRSCNGLIRTPMERRAAGLKVRESVKAVQRFYSSTLEDNSHFSFTWKQAYNVTPSAKEQQILAD